MNICSQCLGENGVHLVTCPLYPVKGISAVLTENSYIQHKIVNLPLLAEILALQAEIDNLAREYAELKEESEKLKAEAAENLEGLQRERASFANFKRRMEQDAMAVYDNSLADHIKPFLPVVDDLERAVHFLKVDL